MAQALARGPGPAAAIMLVTQHGKLHCDHVPARLGPVIRARAVTPGPAAAAPGPAADAAVASESH